MAILHITLATRDVERMARFFQQTMEWVPIERPRNIHVPAAWLRIGAEQELHLVYVADFAPSACEREFGRHVAVSYPVEQFRHLKERLLLHGAEIIDPVRETPFERFFFREPNGYVFEVVAQRDPNARE